MRADVSARLHGLPLRKAWLKPACCDHGSQVHTGDEGGTRLVVSQFRCLIEYVGLMLYHRELTALVTHDRK